MTITVWTKPAPSLPQDVVLTIVKNLLRFPFPQICRHSVALDLLGALEAEGYPLSLDLATAVCRARDDEALAILEASQ